METLYFAESDESFVGRLEQELRNVFKENESIAIKLHMGERKNPNHLKPGFVKKVVGVLKAIGVKPFLFDSPVMYNSDRHTVEGYKKQCEELGFTEQVVGCPVMVSDESIDASGKYMPYQVCRHLAEADGVLVLTHFKGHGCTGIGGSIKNLGMGALTKKSKGDIHTGAQPQQDLSGKCALCKKCMEVCPVNCITYNDGKGDESGPCFDYDACYGCSKCIQNCPQKCLTPKVAEMDILLADGAATAFGKFKKVYFVNVIRSITNRCDCARADFRVVLPDIGILMGKDIVAIDMASLYLVNQKAGKKLFDELWHKDSELQIREAGRLGMGQPVYEIKDA